jgi:hypothetical protein
MEKQKKSERWHGSDVAISRRARGDANKVRRFTLGLVRVDAIKSARSCHCAVGDSGESNIEVMCLGFGCWPASGRCGQIKRTDYGCDCRTTSDKNLDGFKRCFNL